jgi:pimeloyl-ACP methyl ester carboxylesterase
LPHIDVGQHSLEYELIEPADSSAAATLVFLHEGLGSLALWKDFPRKVVAATGCKALVYSRRGYGSSSALSGARATSFMHEEATLVLPRLLDLLHIDHPILFGHSDGASIALIHAADAARSVRGLIVMAPHIMVEDMCIEKISAAKHGYASSGMREKLRRYQSDPDGAFWGWCNIWLDPQFRAWNIEDIVARIACPTLAIQGFDDEYGSMQQLEGISRLVAGVQLLKLENCGHSPHRDQPNAVIEATAEFIRRLPKQDAGMT